MIPDRSILRRFGSYRRGRFRRGIRRTGRLSLVLRLKIDGRLGDRWFLAHQAVLTFGGMTAMPPARRRRVRVGRFAAALHNSKRQTFLAFPAGTAFHTAPARALANGILRLKKDYRTPQIFKLRQPALVNLCLFDT